MRFSRVVIFTMVFFATLTLVNAQLTCTIEESTTCQTGKRYLGLQNQTGGISFSHVESWEQETYTHSLCCNVAEGELGRECNDATLLRLHQSTNAHAQVGSETSYPVPICLSYEPGGVTCKHVRGACDTGVCMFSLTSSTNAHVGVCGEHPVSVCCEIVVKETPLVQQEAVVGQPVQWKKTIAVAEENHISLDIPRTVQDMTIKVKGDGFEETLTKENLRTQEGESLSLFIEKEQRRKQFPQLITRTFGVASQEEDVTVDFPVDSGADFVELTYETEPPRLIEEKLTEGKTRITITSETHYENIRSQYVVGNVPKESITLYWYNKGRKQQITDIRYIDTDNDKLINKIEWIVPHLSDQVYELDLDILNPIEYLLDGETWHVYFTTVGIGDLIITSPNAYWEEVLEDNEQTIDEMEFLSLHCGEELRTTDVLIRDDEGDLHEYSSLEEDDSIKPEALVVEDYFCNETAELQNYMNIAGYAVLNFTFTNGEETVSKLAIDPAPSQNNPILNATDNPYNTTDANLTIYTDNITDSDGLNAINATYDWRIENTSIAALIMTFNTNVSSVGSTIDDPSTYQNNATLGNGSGEDPEWIENSYLGGGYDFDGGDFLHVNASASLSPGDDNFTIMFWFKTGSGSALWLMGPGGGSNDRIRITFSSGQARVDVSAGIGSGVTLLSGSSLTDDNWHHFAFVREGLKSFRMYINGSSVDSDTHAGSSTSIDVPDHNVTIGRAASQYLTGEMDEVYYFTRYLTPDQISAIYEYNNTLWVSNETRVGENWSTYVTLTDGENESAASASNTVQIQNSIDVTTCGVLSSADTVYKLQNDISNSSTCLYIKANGITLLGNGYRINYSTADTAGYGIRVMDASGVTIRDLSIVEGASGTSSKYGIYADNADQLTIDDVAINTTASDSNGIDVDSDTVQMTVKNSQINVSGSSSACIDDSGSFNIVEDSSFVVNSYRAIYQRESNNIIRRNNFSGGGSEGLYIEGNNNTARENIFSMDSSTGLRFNDATNSTATNNTFNEYGISVSGLNNDNVTIQYNTLNTTTTNADLILLSVANGILISSNTIQTNSSSSHGIYFLTNGNDSTVYNNTITAYGSTSAAIQVDGHGNNVSNNSFFADAYRSVQVGGDNNLLHGNIMNASSSSSVRVDGDNNNFTGNTIISESSGPALDLRSSSEGAFVAYNTITGTGVDAINIDSAEGNINLSSNTISATGSSGEGVYFESYSTQGSYVYNNSITTTGTSAEGIYFVNNGNNTIRENTINVTNYRAIVLNGISHNNTFDNNTIVDNGQDQLYFDTAGINHTKLVDQDIFDFTFTGTGSQLSVEVTAYGQINYTSNISGSGSNLSDEIQVTNNSVFVDAAGNAGFNVSANVSIYNANTLGFSSPVIFKDGSLCSDCTALNDLSSARAVFNTTSWSNVSLGEGAPTHDAPVLNATDHPHNGTHANLTVYDQNAVDADGDNITFAYDWRVNETSIAVLHLPFDIPATANESGDVKSYTSHQNNGTAGNNSSNAPTYASNGTIGGAYYFNASELDRITIPYVQSLNVSDELFTWSVWIRTTDTNGHFITQYSANENFWLGLDGGHAELQVQTDSGCTMSVDSTTTINDDNWHHIVGLRRNETVLDLYVNGSFVNTTQESCSELTLDSTTEYSIGLRSSDESNVYEGYLDELYVFNRSLNAHTILALYEYNGTLLASNETIVDENWTVALTPFDGKGAGETKLSNNVTILNNSPPSHGIPIINTTYNGNGTNENLTGHAQYVIDYDGDGVIFTFDWLVNGTSLAVLNMPFNTNVSSTETGAVRDYTDNEHDGSLEGSPSGPPIWNASGVVGGAYTFDTDNSTIVIPANENHTNLTALTAMMWVYLRDTSATHRMISKGSSSGANRGWHFELRDTRRLSFEVDFGTQGSSNNLQRESTTQITYESWVHVAVVWNGSSDYESVQFYINGTEVSYGTNTSGTGSRVDDSTRTMQLGRAQNSQSRPFNGTLDEVLLFNRTLSQNQILAHFYRGRDNLNYSTFVSDETVAGENWTVAVTPTDGQAEGPTRISSELTILSNSAPTHDTPIVNATDHPTNSSAANLTTHPQNAFDVDGDNIKNITTWYVNSTSFTLLNMPFEGYSNASFTRDYSGYGRNGTVNGSLYSMVSGYDGFGTYVFDGIDDYIDIGTSTAFNFTSNGFTVTAWMYLNDTSSHTLVATDNSTTGWGVSVVSDQLTFVTRGTTDDTTTSSTSLNTGQWIHVAAVFTGSGRDRILYLNGSQDATESITGSLSSNANDLYLGLRPGNASPLNGTLDEVRIYNRSLSADQIQALYQNQTTTIVSDETTEEDSWNACVTATDAESDSETLCSNSVTITNAAPTHTTPVLNATDHPNNRTSANLTGYNQSTADSDGETVYNTYDFRVGGSSLAVLHLPFNTNVTSTAVGAVLDYSSYQNNGTLRNLTASDYPAWNSTGFYGGGYSFNNNSYIDVITDEDFFEENMTVSFWVNMNTLGSEEQLITQGNTTEGFTIIKTSGNDLRVTLGGRNTNVTSFFTAANQWNHVTVSWNGSELFVYRNGSSLQNSTNVNTTNLNHSATDLRIGSNPSAQPFAGNIDQVIIFNRTLSSNQILEIYQNYTVITSDETRKGDSWTVAVTPSDGNFDGTTLTSSSLTILGSPPTTPTLLTPVDSNGTVFDRFTYFNWTDSTHPDGFAINYTFQINESPSCGSIVDRNVTVSEYTSVDELCVDNEYNWSVQACDKFLVCSDYASPFNFSIASVVSLVFTTDTVNFSTLEPSTPSLNVTNSTFDNNPTPFLITNDGNLDINIDVQSTVALWANASLGTYHWQYADQATTSWVNVSGSYQDFYDGLAWTGTDTREMEINVTVPVSETPGSKQGTLQVLAASAE